GAAHVLHHDEERVLRAHQVGGAHDVHVIEGGGDLRFAEEEVAELGAGGELGEELLEHYLLLEAARAQLLAQVDRAHAPFSQISLDAILPGRGLGGHPDPLDSLFFRSNAMSFPLQTLLTLRRRAEEEAEREVALAVADCAQAEAEQRRLAECAAAAWARARAGRDGEAATAGERLTAERFRQRLAEEAGRADEAALTHRKGALAIARAAEEAARERHAGARRERQAAEQASEREATEERRVAERRAEEAISDLAAARRRG